MHMLTYELLCAGQNQLFSYFHIQRYAMAVNYIRGHWLWVLFMMLSSKPIYLEKHAFFYPFKIQYMLNFVRLKRTIRVCLKYQEFTVCLSFLYNFEFVQLVLNNKPGKVHY